MSTFSNLHVVSVMLCKDKLERGLTPLEANLHTSSILIFFFFFLPEEHPLKFPLVWLYEQNLIFFSMYLGLFLHVSVPLIRLCGRAPDVFITMVSQLFDYLLRLILSLFFFRIF